MNRKNFCFQKSNRIASILIVCLSFSISSWQNEKAPSLDGKSFQVKIIPVENEDIITSGKIMSQLAEVAQPDSIDKRVKPVLTTIIDFEKGRFYSPVLPTAHNANESSNSGCLYKISTVGKEEIMFDAICEVYSTLFKNQPGDSLNMEAPINKPVATWGGKVKNNFIEGTISWEGVNGKRNYYYYSGYKIKE